MLNPLSSRNQSGIFDFRIGFFLNHFSSFSHNTFHSFAFWGPGRLLVTFQNFFQTLGLIARLSQMVIERRGESPILRRLGHLWQRLDDLVLSAVKIF